MPMLAPTGFAPSTAAAMGYGYREDLSKDAVTNLDPADSYFTKKCSRITCGLRHDWLADNLPRDTSLPRNVGAATTTAILADLTANWAFNTTIARKRFFNQTQYVYVPWSIAQAAERAAELGQIAGDINSEIAQEVERMNRFFGQRIEAINLSAQAERVDSGSSGTEGLLSGFFDSTNWNQFSGATVPLSWNAISLPDLVTFNAIGQDDIETLMLQSHNNGATGPLTAYMSTDFFARIAKTWVGRPGYQVTQAVGEHMIDNQVFTYMSRSGIGQIDFVSNRTMNGTGAIAFVNHNYVKLGEFIPMRVYERPYINRNHEGVWEAQWTLVDKNPQAHARIYTAGGVTPTS